MLRIDSNNNGGIVIQVCTRWTDAQSQNIVFLAQHNDIYGPLVLLVERFVV